MIYVHIPLCRSFCVYCAFYSEICAKGEGVNPFSEALVREIASSTIPEGLDSLYFGGGTPSLLPLDSLRKIVEALSDACRRSRVGLSAQGVGRNVSLCCTSERADFGNVGTTTPPDLWKWDEFTFEANPDDIVKGGGEYVTGLKDLGVNRISMGAQSFSDAMLRKMGRRHSASDISKAVRIVKDAGIDNVSLDLIFGISGLDDSTLAQSIDSAVSLGIRHLSLYQLSIEEGSALEQMIKMGQYREMDAESCARQYGLICAKMAECGFEHYEISNFALPGFRSRHNSAYWNHTPYIGFGPGAHSLEVDNGSFRRRWNAPDLKSYISEGPKVESETLTEEQIAIEKIMLSLRTSEGLDASYLKENKAAERLLESGRLEYVTTFPASVPTPSASASSSLSYSLNGRRIRIPEKYFFVCDDIIRSLI